MPRFALIDTNTNVMIELRQYSTQPPNPAGKQRKWLPCPNVATPSFDPTAQKLTGQNYAVGASEVAESWSVVSLTAQEISDLKDAAVAGINGAAFSPLLRALFNLNNRVRYLEGQAAMTIPQFKAAIKAML